MMDHEIESNGGAQRLADQRCPRHSDGLHEFGEEAGEDAAVIDRHRLFRLAEADMVDRDDAVVRRKSLDLRHPARALAAGAMQEDDRVAAPGLQIVYLEAEHRCVLGY